MIISEIPGFKAAMEAARNMETSIRESVFLGDTTEICGIEVLHFTFRHYINLRAAESPFVCGGAPEVAHVLQFLWGVCPQFRNGIQARQAFLDSLPEFDFAEACAAIVSYLDTAMMDWEIPHRTDEDEAPIVSAFAVILHEFARAWGIPGSLARLRKSLLDMPMIELAQYRRLITLDRNPRHHFANPISGRLEMTMIREAIAHEHAEEQTAKTE